MQACARGAIRHAREHGPAGQIRTRVGDADFVPGDIGGAEVALIAAHLIEEVGRTAQSHKIGVALAARQEHPVLIEDSGDVSGIEALLEQFRQPLGRHAETEEMGELAVLHDSGGDVVDRLLRYAPDNDPADHWLFTLAHFAVARQLFGWQGRPERNAGVDEVAACPVPQHYVGADVVANLRGLMVESFMIADR
jgi:hypothetical protein